MSRGRAVRTVQAPALADEPCACSAEVPCLLHYGDMREDQRWRIRDRLGIHLLGPQHWGRKATA
jgi:hypothetical protein